MSEDAQLGANNEMFSVCIRLRATPPRRVDVFLRSLAEHTTTAVRHIGRDARDSPAWFAGGFGMARGLLGANRELAMKQLGVVICILTMGFAISTPARADFAVVQFGDGYCRIWHDSGADPWGASWRKIAIGLPTWSAASFALDSARAQNVCP
jgi:hypothetical protein